MEPHKLYIQQTQYNGISYTKGVPKDTLSEWNIICRDFPFVLHPESKDYVTKDWKGRDGLSVYIPRTAKVKDYDVKVTFLYVGTHGTMRTDIGNFCDFIMGRPEGDYSARLSIYDEYVQTGRKDVAVKSIEFNTYWDLPDYDTDAIADFTVTFHVYDPTTNLTPVFTSNVISDLAWT